MDIVLEEIPVIGPQFDDENLYYKVSVPLKKIMAGNRFFGITDEENMGMYTIEAGQPVNCQGNRQLSRRFCLSLSLT